MKIYLDNCCYNRPYDDQSQFLVYLETQAKLEIQRRIAIGDLELVSSYVLEYEHNHCPYEEQRRAIGRFIAKNAKLFIGNEKEEVILNRAKPIMQAGIKRYDALHVACAIEAECDYFISTDKRLLKYQNKAISLVNPVEFIFRRELI